MGPAVQPVRDGGNEMQRSGEQAKNPLLSKKMARPEGFEPPTPTFVALYSIQLSYGRAF